jgi:predicted alpha/beta-fold hydrolase
MESRRRREQSHRSARPPAALKRASAAGAVTPPDTGFEPPRWLRDAHLQSILPSLPPHRYWARWRARALLKSSTAWELDCGEGVRLLAWHGPGTRPGAGTAVLLHGWEGSAESCYVLSLGALLHEHGYGVVRLNLRDHGGTHALNRDLFHSCRLADVTGALRAIAARCGGERLYLAGFSLGANFLLRACAEPALPPSVAGAVAISPVLDPDRALRALEQGAAIYHSYFVRRWSRSLRRKQRSWPDHYEFAELLRSRNLRAMTDHLVRACTEFADMACYLEGYAITGARLLPLSVPARVLIAEDDPIIPAGDLARLAPTPLLRVRRTAHGGHCGFLRWPMAHAWSDHYVLAQFAAFQAEAASAAA